MNTHILWESETKMNWNSMDTKLYILFFLFYLHIDALGAHLCTTMETGSTGLLPLLWLLIGNAFPKNWRKCSSFLSFFSRKSSCNNMWKFSTSKKRARFSSPFCKNVTAQKRPKGPFVSCNWIPRNSKLIFLVVLKPKKQRSISKNNHQIISLFIKKFNEPTWEMNT